VAATWAAAQCVPTALCETPEATLAALKPCGNRFGVDWIAGLCKNHDPAGAAANAAGLALDRPRSQDRGKRAWDLLGVSSGKKRD